jgi:hypothetical protein
MLGGLYHKFAEIVYLSFKNQQKKKVKDTSHMKTYMLSYMYLELYSLNIYFSKKGFGDNLWRKKNNVMVSL